MPPSTNANIAFCGSPGVSIENCQLTIQGQGLEPNTDVTVDVHSTPTQVGATTVQANGRFDVAASLPRNLAIGVHHVIVNGKKANGSPFIEEEVFTVVKGDRLGSIGWVPPAPLAGDIQFVPSSHRTVVLAATAGVTAAAAAVASGLGGGLALGGGGSAPVGGGSGGGGSRGLGGASLEGVELERLEGESREEGLGDRSKTWRWPGTKFLDRWSKTFPRKAATISPVAGRVIIDGDYLRAVLGSVWIGLCLASIGLGAYASASSGWYAVPPSLGLFLVILALGVFDSLFGLLAGSSFILCSLFAGHITSAPELRLSMGLFLVWFAVPLAAAALRPLRRAVSLRIDALWERMADLVVCGLFAAWVADKMTSALSGLSGVELPINHDVGTIVLAVLAFVGIRIIVETIVVHYFPGRLASVRHEGRLESGKLQRAVSLAAQIVVFVFIAVAILGASWALIVGALIFFTPLTLELFEERIPKSRKVAKWKPNGIVSWAIIIATGVLLGELLKHTLHSGHLVEEVGFIVLPIPVVVFWLVELFEEKKEEGEREDEERALVERTETDEPVRSTRTRERVLEDVEPRGLTRRANGDGPSVALLEVAQKATGVRARTGRGPQDQLSPVDESPALRQGRSKKQVILLASSPVDHGSAHAPRGGKKSGSFTEFTVHEQSERSLVSARYLVARKWMMRCAGVALVVVSVLLVHLQGGG
jgi:hypothetical protein